MPSFQKITPFLWFDNNAEEAANFYTSIFNHSRITATTRYGDAASQASRQPQGSVMTVAFELDGQPFTALNGGPHFHFTEAVSFVVHCETQEELDYFWEKLSADPTAGQCGWLKDKYGLSWQIIPASLPELLGGEPEKAQRAMQALMQMKKLDIDELRRARNGG
jgi:predicted 3-demethylubiquinone-9 3-methyltransferase (glyoxalase superfamily)